jgi:peptide/nickel transport system permease protein
MTSQPADLRVIRARRSFVENAWRTLKTAPFTAWLGMFIILVYAIAAIFAPWIAPFGESEVVGKQYLPPSAEFWFGTDQIGRDMFSRVIYGARNTIGIALATTLLSFIIGGTLGVLTALKRGWLDQTVSRIVDAFLAIPVLIFALMLLAVFRNSINDIVLLIVILALLDSTRVFRLARATALNVVVMDYVEAARLRGEGNGWIVFKEILPNILPPMITEFGLRFCFVFLTISALSFLGVGIQPPTADWGSMVAESKTLITFGRAQPLIPAACIAILTVGVNFVVDWFLHKTSGLRE